MKTKKLALSLVAIFMSVAFLTAQTATPAKSVKSETQKEVKCDKKADGKTCCKETGKACDKKADVKKPVIEKK